MSKTTEAWAAGIGRAQYEDYRQVRRDIGEAAVRLGIPLQGSAHDLLTRVLARLGEREPQAAYHPDPVINAEVAADAQEGEVADLGAGYPPSPWRCPECGTEHDRGHFGAVGQHRCLGCGYIGTGGVMLDD